MLMRILEVVFPVFAIVLAGWWYGRRHQPDMVAANRLNMEMFVPALVFAALADGHFDVRAHLAPAAAMALMVLGSGLLAWPVARLAGIAARTLVPPMMFNNCGNLGLPFALLVFGQDIVPTAVMLFITSNLLHFTLGAWMLDRHLRLQAIWRVPVVMASFAGLACSLAGLHPWPPLHLAFHMLGEISVPLMLFSLGVKVSSAPITELRIGLGGGLLRPALGALLMVPLTWLFGIEGQQAGLCLLFGALPPAVLNFLFADRHHQEPERVASIVVVGNLLTVLVVPLTLAVILAVPRFH